MADPYDAKAHARALLDGATPPVPSFSEQQYAQQALHPSATEAPPMPAPTTDPMWQEASWGDGPQPSLAQISAGMEDARNDKQMSAPALVAAATPPPPEPAPPPAPAPPAQEDYVKVHGWVPRGQIGPQLPTPGQDAAAQAVGAPLRLIPGGWQSKSRTIATGITGQDADAAHGALDEQASAGQQAIALGQQKGIADAAATTAYMDQVAQQQRIMAAEQAKSQAEKADAIQYNMDKLDALQGQAQAGQIDPNHMWDSMSTPSKVMASIGLILGGFGAGLSKGPNQAIAILQQKVDADIEAQKANLQNKHQAVQNQRGLLGEMYTAFGNMDAAKLATQTAMLSSAKSDLDALVAKTGDQAVKQRGLEASAALANQIADNRMKAAQIFGQRETTSQAYRAPGYVGGPGGDPGAGHDPKLFVPTGPNGQGYEAPTEKEAAKGRVLATNLELLNTLDLRAAKLRAGLTPGEIGWNKHTPFATSTYEELASIQAQREEAVRRIAEQKRLSPQFADQAVRAAGDYTKAFGDPAAASNSFRSGLRAELDAAERGSGAQGVTNTPTVDQYGNVGRVSVGNATMGEFLNLRISAHREHPGRTIVNAGIGGW